MKSETIEAFELTVRKTGFQHKAYEALLRKLMPCYGNSNSLMQRISSRI